jgi:hypothetical protein
MQHTQKIEATPTHPPTAHAHATPAHLCDARPDRHNIPAAALALPDLLRDLEPPRPVLAVVLQRKVRVCVCGSVCGCFFSDQGSANRQKSGERADHLKSMHLETKNALLSAKQNTELSVSTHRLHSTRTLTAQGFPSRQLHKQGQKQSRPSHALSALRTARRRHTAALAYKYYCGNTPSYLRTAMYILIAVSSLYASCTYMFFKQYRIPA